MIDQEKSSNSSKHKFKIADHIIQLDLDDRYIHTNMQAFTCNNKEQTELIFQIAECESFQVPVNSPLISSSYYKIYQLEQNYILFYPSFHEVIGCFYDTKLQVASIYLSNDLTPLDKTDPQTASLFMNSIQNSAASIPSEFCIADFIFFIIRDVFFIFLQQHNVITVHSSSIIYRDKAYLFSACSGTGKTTHTNMWVERFGVEILDGDITATYVDQGKALAYGLPWCGSSECYQNRCVPLGGIIFLTRSQHNSLRLLPLFEAIICLSARCFTPTWTKELINNNITIAESIASRTLCCSLNCLPNQEAVDVVKNFIDANY